MDKTSLFVDTTIQVDRVIQRHIRSKREEIEALLDGYDLTLACAFSRLEFKRVVLQNLSLCLTYLIEEQSFSLALSRARGIGARNPRRFSTLVGIMSWIIASVQVPGAVEVGDSLDEQLTMQGISFLRTNILYLWKWFDKSVDSTLDRTQCARAREGPERTPEGNVLVHVRESLCRNQECNNANFFRSQLPVVRKICSMVDRLEASGGDATAELKKARDGLKQAATDPSRLYDYKNCLGIGDVWIHLESSAGGIKDFATTNYKESQHLCPAIGLNMKQP